MDEPYRYLNLMSNSWIGNILKVKFLWRLRDKPKQDIDKRKDIQSLSTVNQDFSLKFIEYETPNETNNEGWTPNPSLVGDYNRSSLRNSPREAGNRASLGNSPRSIGGKGSIDSEYRDSTQSRQTLQKLDSFTKSSLIRNKSRHRYSSSSSISIVDINKKSPTQQKLQYIEYRATERVKSGGHRVRKEPSFTSEKIHIILPSEKLKITQTQLIDQCIWGKVHYSHFPTNFETLQLIDIETIYGWCLLVDQRAYSKKNYMYYWRITSTKESPSTISEENRSRYSSSSETSTCSEAHTPTSTCTRTLTQPPSDITMNPALSQVHVHTEDTSLVHTPDQYPRTIDHKSSVSILYPETRADTMKKVQALLSTSSSSPTNTTTTHTKNTTDRVHFYMQPI